MSAKRKLKSVSRLGRMIRRRRRPKETSGPDPLGIPRAPRQVLGARLKSPTRRRKLSRIFATSITRSIHRGRASRLTSGCSRLSTVEVLERSQPLTGHR